MKERPPKRIQNPTEHEKNIHFAFHEFGFFGINQYRILLFFWVFELTYIPKLLSDAFHGQESAWMNYVFSHSNNYWIAHERTPTLEYAGVYIIALALTHPWFIIKVISKIKFLEFEIKRTLGDIRTIVYCIFIALLSSRLVDLCLVLAKILTMGSPVSSIVLY